MTTLEAIAIDRPPEGVGKLVRAFRTNKLAGGGLVLLVVILVVTVLAPLFAGQDPAVQDVMHKLEGPSAAHIFGTDEFGRDI